MTVDRFTLEEQITNTLQIQDDLETLIYKIGDSPDRPTEDQTMNMLIGIIELHKTRHEQLWYTFETLLKEGKILT